jgi:putative protease
VKIITYLDNLEDISSDVVADVILSPKELSRTGEINLSELDSLADKCWIKGIRPILEWDILMTEDLFSRARENLEKINLNNFFAIRVQDPGAINYILEHHPELKIQLILETANHNFKSIETWIDFIGSRLERVVLSIEIPKDILEVYLKRLKDLEVRSEFLGLGKVLLFYTPRSLLSPLTGSRDEKIEALATGEETPHKNFPVMENSHGTFMYNTRDHFLLDHLKELRDMGLSFLRLDLRGSNPLILPKITQLVKSYDPNLVEEIKNLYPRKISKGFYKANKTDVLFKKLKNKNLGKGHGHYLGDVIDVRKKKLMGIQFKTPGVDLNKGDYLEIRTPEGRVKNIQVKEMLDSNLNPMEKVHSGKVFFMSHVGGVSVRSRIFKEDRI